MTFGIPVELKNFEDRVGAVPALVEQIVSRGHMVLVETHAGECSGFSDASYERCGAVIVPSPEKLYSQADVILKVQEPMPVEYELIRPDHIICGYFYFLQNLDISRALMARGCTCIGYDLLNAPDGDLPLSSLEQQLHAMTAVAQAEVLMHSANDGRGRLLGSVAGSRPANVTVVGTSHAALTAALFAKGRGANVFLLATAEDELALTQDRVGPGIMCESFGSADLATVFGHTDILIGATGNTDESAAPVSAAELQYLPAGCVIVDLDIRFGSSIEGARSTSPTAPMYIEDEHIFFCVPVLAGSIPRSASEALSNTLLPYLTQAIEIGFDNALRNETPLASATAFFEGRVSNQRLANALGVTFYPLNQPE